MWSGKRSALQLSLVIGALGCSRAADVPSAPDVMADSTSVGILDPFGDAFATAGTPWDVTALAITRQTDGITVRLEFATELSVPTRGDPNALVGLVEFDLDQNPATGHEAELDRLRADGGSTGMGVDGGVNLTTISADSTVEVYDAVDQQVGRAKVTFAGNRMTIRIPKALIANDDGYVDASVIVGNGRSPTDFAPTNGHLSMHP